MYSAPGSYHSKTHLRTPKCAACGAASPRDFCERCLRRYPALRHLVQTPRRVGA
jgi:hypothetical protein